MDSLPRNMRAPWFVAALTLAVLMAGCSDNDNSTDDNFAGTPQPRGCAQLAQLELLQATITAAEAVAATDNTPAYCRVAARIEPETDVELHLPAPHAWQGRYLHLGGGGFDGSPPASFAAAPVAVGRGYAVAASNGGHNSDAPIPATDPTWALNSPMLIRDYAHRAIGKTRDFASAVIEAYYGQAPQYAYFQGCSNGGRGAFNAAAKYTSDFDGVVAGAPVRYLPNQVVAWTSYGARVQAGIPENPAMDRDAKLEALYEAQVSSCDLLDGVADGIVSNPGACAAEFEWADVQCTTDANDCLTESETEVVRSVFSELELASGQSVYAGFPPAALLGSWLNSYSAYGLGHLQYIVYQDPAYGLSDYDIDTAYPKTEAVTGGIYDFSPNLGPLASYLAMGKKMIVWHGTGDGLISSNETAAQYQQITDLAGVAASANARLYMLPGVNHCRGGPGADMVNWLAAITQWVEKGQAPMDLVASGAKSDLRPDAITRPVCEYPQYPAYVGSGDPDRAQSYRCVMP